MRNKQWDVYSGGGRGARGEVKEVGKERVTESEKQRENNKRKIGKLEGKGERK